MPTSFRPVELVFDRPASTVHKLRGSFSWSRYLTSPVIRENSDEFSVLCSDVAVPVECFQVAPLQNYMKHYSHIKLLVEVPLSAELRPPNAPENAYWFARVLKIAGYRLLLRYLGMDASNSEKHDFWMNIGSLDLKHVGYCGEDPCVRPLVAPRVLDTTHCNYDYYQQYLTSCCSVAFNWPTVQKELFNCCKFVRGNRVELLNTADSSNQVRPALVVKTVGHRVFLKLSFADIYPEPVPLTDKQMDGIWLEQDSPLIFYVGWSLRVGYRLHANSKYKKHAKEIADAINSNLEALPLENFDASPVLFEKNYEAPQTSVCWQKGMELEILDPTGSYKELRCGTVVDIILDNYLVIGLKGMERDNNQVPIHCSSSLLFPVGYADNHGLKVRGPEDKCITNHKEVCKNPAPEELFDNACEAKVELFQVGAKLEAVDMCDTQLICPASIASRKGRLLEIKFDSYGYDYRQILDFRSADLMPLGWCEIYGYRLEQPLSKATFTARMKSYKNHTRVTI
uniref:Scm-like with four MBT domains protein 2 n=1 Tax=Syphacia muris TaxID=451379 RepID=A0A0N5ANS1_9BILA